MKTQSTYFNEKLKECRKKLGITQETMASLVGMKRSNYAHLESEGNPSLETLIKLSAILKVSVDSLLGDNEILSHSELDKIAASMHKYVLKSPNAFDTDLERKINEIMRSADNYNDLDSVEKEIILNYRIMSNQDKNKIIALIKKINK